MRGVAAAEVWKRGKRSCQRRSQKEEAGREVVLLHPLVHHHLLLAVQVVLLMIDLKEESIERRKSQLLQRNQEKHPNHFQEKVNLLSLNLENHQKMTF